MPHPFPGMNPYLERPGLWEEVHTRLIVAIADWLGPRVRPRYRVAVEQRTYVDLAFVGAPARLVGKPDVLVTAVEGEAVPDASSLGPSRRGTAVVAERPLLDDVVERFLEVRVAGSGEVVTVMELLSPSNKRSGEGRRTYDAKRSRVLGTRTNLVEIDLIRAGDPMPMRLPPGVPPGDYRIVVSRSPTRPRADVYAFSLRDPIPAVPVPLLPDDQEPLVPLNQLLHELYDRAGYDLTVDYAGPLDPPLAPDDSVWIASRLAS